MEFLKKYWPLLMTIVASVGSALIPSIEAFWAAHPQLVAILSGAYAAFKWALPSPLQK